ncbi:peptidase [Serratia fonticola]|uniref:Rz1-like lysis system protein LysC n=2 Tax=Serratia fonticola TaxID=47917 RepID=UPI003AAB67C2
MSVLFALSLMPLLIISGCSNTQLVPVYPPKINPELTAATPIPKTPTPLLYGDSLVLNAQLFVALGQCNRDKAAIREIEDVRQ